jgi:Zn-dependent protease
MMFHELAHGGVAYLLGDLTAKADGRLTLNPLKHLDPFMSVLLPLVSYLLGGVVFGGAKPVPVNSKNLRGGMWGMALVASAGPLTNFVLAFISFLILELSPLTIESGIIYSILYEMVFVNLGFGVFNMIPIPPLDGSRVLYVLMPDGVRKFMKKIEPMGIVVVYMLIIVGGGFFTSIMGNAINGILNGFYWIIGK